VRQAHEEAEQHHQQQHKTGYREFAAQRAPAAISRGGHLESFAFIALSRSGSCHVELRDLSWGARPPVFRHMRPNLPGFSNV